MNEIIKEILKKKKEQFGSKASVKDLAEQFAEYWESGERIKVKFSYGETKTGTVGITTGRSPVFILMLTKRSVGSSWTLSKEDKIVGIGEAKEHYKYNKI